jgi:hypothetical protein
MGGWCAARLANADTYTGKRKLEEILRDAAYRRHRRPHGQRYRYQPDAVGACVVGVASDGDAKHCIEDSKCWARQQPKLRIAQAKFVFHGFGKDGDDLPVEKVEDVNNKQHPQHRLGLG